MSRFVRLSILIVALAAVNLAGMIAIAQAQTKDPSTQRPPIQGQVGSPTATTMTRWQPRHSEPKTTLSSGSAAASGPHRSAPLAP
jgi:hypothetical protein